MNIKPPKSPAYVKDLAKEMRRKPTPAEDLLWQKLRRKALDGFKFYRQYAIGRFITDFGCPEKKLIIELDGEIHDQLKNIVYDEERSSVLVGLGYQIVRIKNEEVLNNMASILYKIRYVLMK